MQVTDPRERTDDLLVTESREELPPDEFREAAASEAATVGWVCIALVFDDGQVLLVDQPWADGWIAPGGALQPGESFDDAVTREVREETGVEIEPVGPRAVDDFAFVDEATGESAGWNLVVYEATARTTAIDDDLGFADEKINAARWFDGLPDDIFNPDLFEPVYERCENAR